MAQKVKCVVKGYRSDLSGHYYINDDTKSVEDIWYTMMPDNYKEENGEPTPIKVFESKAEAEEYKRAIVRQEKQQISNSPHYVQPTRWEVQRV